MKSVHRKAANKLLDVRSKRLIYPSFSPAHRRFNMHAYAFGSFSKNVTRRKKLGFIGR